uniref:Uncharacterized protein n=1 Tax=Lepisosteus oculatus TaxID=7918 RepID=W5M1S7_LEPOC
DIGLLRPDTSRTRGRFGRDVRLCVFLFCSREEIPADEHVTQELEDAVRVVLANLDSLQPFATEHFNIFPYKSQWERVSKLTFLQGSSALHAYPFVCTLYVE